MNCIKHITDNHKGPGPSKRKYPRPFSIFLHSGSKQLPCQQKAKGVDNTKQNPVNVLQKSDTKVPPTNLYCDENNCAEISRNGYGTMCTEILNVIVGKVQVREATVQGFSSR